MGSSAQYFSFNIAAWSVAPSSDASGDSFPLYSMAWSTQLPPDQPSSYALCYGKVPENHSCHSMGLVRGLSVHSSCLPSLDSAGGFALSDRLTPLGSSLSSPSYVGWKSGAFPLLSAVHTVGYAILSTFSRSCCSGLALSSLQIAFSSMLFGPHGLFWPQYLRSVTWSHSSAIPTRDTNTKCL